MASVNKVTLIGNSCADAEVRYLPNGDAVATVRIATSESWKDKTTGEKKEITEFHRVVFYRKLAEIVGQYVKKGTPLYVEGRIRTRKWQDKEGQERSTVEIEASEMQLLGSRSNSGASCSKDGDASRPASTGGGGGNAASTPSSAPARQATNFEDMDDDLPFGSCTIAYDPMFVRATSTRAQRRRV